LSLTTDTTDLGGYAIGLPEVAATHDYYAAGGVTFPEPGGFLWVDTSPGSKVAGIQVSLAPASGVGPLYGDAGFDPAPDPGLQAGSRGVREGARGVRTGARAVRTGARVVRTGARAVRTGARAVRTGARAVRKKAHAVRTGARAVRTGARAVRKKAHAVRTGA